MTNTKSRYPEPGNGFRRITRHDSAWRQRYAWAAILLAACVGCDSRPAAENPRSETAAVGPSGAIARVEKPNIVLYVIDTLRADNLRCYGNPDVDTPTMDRFAGQGVLFLNAIAPSSWTRASMASILTALDPPAHGVQGRDDILSDRVLLLSEHLKQHGYHTGCITANPNIGSCFGFNQGFDTFSELYTRRSAGSVSALELVAPSSTLTNHAVEWLAQVPRPFFLVILTIDPHSPYTPPPEFDRYGGDYAGPVDGTRQWINRPDLRDADKKRIRSLYSGEVAFNDDSLGTLLARLRDTGLDQQTIVAVTSDHGEEFWEHGRRGHGAALFEESIHVPLMLRYPGVAAGTRVARTVQLVDVFPTLLQLAGLPIPGELDGRSLFDDTAGDDIAFASLFHDRHQLLAARAYPWKLIWDHGSRQMRLFDLTASPNELADVADAYPEQRTRLFERITERMRRYAERFATIHGGEEQERISREQLPEDVLKLLKALGYIDGS